jgi:23S rRNA pseudouridine955/2504/2580 synthase
METTTNKHLVTIDKNYDKIKLDKFLADKYSVSFSLTRKMARKGQIRLNSSRVKGNEILKIGDIVKIPGLFLHYLETSTTEAENKENLFTDKQIRDAKDLIIYEDDDLLVINKPAGIPVQAGSNQDKSIDRLFSEVYPENPPKLVHRLDKDTSGCLVMAKNKSVAKALVTQFSKRKTHKKYLTIVTGSLHNPSGEIDFNVEKQFTEHNKERMKVVEYAGKDAKTFYNRIARNKNYHFLEVEIETGRTHQIRVHMESIGTPILGDDKYSDKQLNKLPSGKKPKMCLHAYNLEIVHPTTEQTMKFEAPVNSKMLEIMDILGFKY